MFWWVVCLCGGNGLGSWVVFCGARVLLLFLGFLLCDFCHGVLACFYSVYVFG